MRVLLGLLLLLAPVDEKARGRAEEALRALAERQKGLKTLRADYVQTRETELSKEPLRSSGTLYYSRAEKCLAFVVEEPREVRIRMDARSYQVYRPERKQAERFVFAKGFPGKDLLRAFTEEVAELAKEYAVAEVREKDGALTIALEPRKKEVRLRRLEVVIEKGALVRVAYAREEGERVEIELRDVERDVEVDERIFARDPPEGTDLRVIEVE